MPRITSVTASFVKSIVTTSDRGLVELHHGAAFEHATWMEKYRLDVARASAGGGEGNFWLAVQKWDAAGYAEATMSDKPTIVTVRFKLETIVSSVTTNPPNCFIHLREEKATHHFQFLGAGFQRLSEQIGSINLSDARPELRKK